MKKVVIWGRRLGGRVGIVYLFISGKCGYSIDIGIGIGIGAGGKSGFLVCMFFTCIAIP